KGCPRHCKLKLADSETTMVQRLTRKELYELVWSEPMKIVSVRFGISDVALKKTCERAAIPTPDRGYWAKRKLERVRSNRHFRNVHPGWMMMLLSQEVVFTRIRHGVKRIFWLPFPRLRNSTNQ